MLLHTPYPDTWPLLDSLARHVEEAVLGLGGEGEGEGSEPSRAVGRAGRLVSQTAPRAPIEPSRQNRRLEVNCSLHELNFAFRTPTTSLKQIFIMLDTSCTSKFPCVDN